MKALVTAEFADDDLARLRAAGYEVVLDGWGVDRQPLEGRRLLDAVRDVDVLICELERVDEEVLAAARRLQVLASCRGDPVNVDLDAATRHGVLVLHTPGRNAASVADFTIGLLLTLVRNIARGQEHLKQAGWNVDGELPYLHFRGPELAGRTLGLVGFGAVGRQVATRAAGGFGMRIAVFDPYADVDQPDVQQTSLDQLLEQADVVSLHAPVTRETTGMIGARELALLGGEGYLVNTARAALVDEGALVEALREGAIAGAALDVFWKEPIPPGHPLFDLGNVVLTPHLAGAATDVRLHHARMVLEDLARIRAGRRPLRLANPTAWKGDGA
jgi:phosphoglycerate dehydrogenase-like enzyme